MALVFIDKKLNIREKIRRLLDLIKDCPVRKPGKKTTGIFPGKLPCVKIFQTGVLFVGKDLAAQGCFAALPRSGNGHHRILLGKPNEITFRCSGYEGHVVTLYRIYANFNLNFKFT
jgi:hypothetical protein